MNTQHQLELALDCLNDADEKDIPAGDAWVILDDLVYEMRSAERLKMLREARAAMRKTPCA